LAQTVGAGACFVIPAIGVIGQGKAIGKTRTHRILPTEGDIEGELPIEEIDAIDLTLLKARIGADPTLLAGELLGLEGGSEEKKKKKSLASETELTALRYA
jgi:hypothetical protein